MMYLNLLIFFMVAAIVLERINTKKVEKLIKEKLALARKVISPKDENIKLLRGSHLIDDECGENVIIEDKEAK